MTYRILFGPWESRANVTADADHAVRIEQILSVECGSHVTLLEGWEALADPRRLAEFLASKGAIVTYMSDTVKRLPVLSTQGRPDGVFGQVLDGELLPAAPPTTVTRKTLRDICATLGFESRDIMKVMIAPQDVIIERQVRGADGRMHVRRDGTMEIEFINLKVVDDGDTAERR